MKIRKCDLCKSDVSGKCGDSPVYGVSFGTYDLCVECVRLVRRAICRDCNGTGKVRVRDDYATDAQASCGENRTQYKTEKCKHCE